MKAILALGSIRTKSINAPRTNTSALTDTQPNSEASTPKSETRKHVPEKSGKGKEKESGASALLRSGVTSMTHKLSNPIKKRSGGEVTESSKVSLFWFRKSTQKTHLPFLDRFRKTIGDGREGLDFGVQGCRRSVEAAQVRIRRRRLCRTH